MLNGVFLFAALIRAQRRVSMTANALRIQRRIWVAKRRTIFWYSSGGAVPPICPSGTRVCMHVCGQNNKLLAELLESDGTQDTRNHRVRGHDLTQCLDDLADNFGHVAYCLNLHLFVIGKNLMSLLDALSAYLCASSTTRSRRAHQGISTTPRVFESYLCGPRHVDPITDVPSTRTLQDTGGSGRR